LVDYFNWQIVSKLVNGLINLLVNWHIGELVNYSIGELRTLVFYNLIHKKEGLFQTFVELTLSYRKIEKITTTLEEEIKKNLEGIGFKI